MNTTNKISFVSLVIALCAFSLAIWQGFAIRNHERMSVRPFLSVEIDIVNNEGGLFIKNIGMGPAIITNIYFMLNGNNISSEKLLSTILTNVSDEIVYEKGLICKSPNGMFGLQGYNGKYMFLGFMNKPTYSDVLNLFDSLIAFVVIIEYETLYDEKIKIELEIIQRKTLTTIPTHFPK